MKLTQRDVDLAQYDRSDNGRMVLWDVAVAGLGVRIYPSGRKAFVISYRAQGRKRLMVIGNSSVIALDEARKRARKKLSQIDDGTDPLAEKKKAAGAATMKALCTDYIERHAKPHKKTWTADERRIQRHILPAWGSRQVVSVTRADVATLHHEIGKNGAPYEANRIVALLGTMFECGKAWGFLPESAANPARRIKKFPEHKRDRFVTTEEMPRLIAAINAEKDVYIRASFWLYLLTGLRRNELLNLKRDQIDWTRKEAYLPDSKAGRPHVSPLSGPAMAVLRQIPALDGNVYLLPGRCIGRPLVEIKTAWQRIRTAAGVPDVRVHDLRRTVGSWLAQQGNSLHLIGRVLNHSSPSTTAGYARFHQDTVRAALEEHGHRLLAVSPETERAA